MHCGFVLLRGFEPYFHLVRHVAGQDDMVIIVDVKVALTHQSFYTPNPPKEGVGLAS